MGKRAGSGHLEPELTRRGVLQPFGVNGGSLGNVVVLMYGGLAWCQMVRHGKAWRGMTWLWRGWQWQQHDRWLQSDGVFGG